MKLRLSPDLELPTDAVTSTLVVYGGKGMGKTNLGSVGETRRLEGFYAVRCEMVTIPAGHMYAFDARRFHRSIVQSGLAVTWVEKHHQREDVRARLLHRRDMEPVHAFGHDMDGVFVNSLVKSAYELLH